MNPSPQKRKRPLTQDYDKKLLSSQERFDEKNDSSGLVLSSSAQDSMPLHHCIGPPKKHETIFLTIGDELDALEAVKNQIELLKDALTSPLDHLTIVEAHGSDATASEMLMDYFR